MAARPTHKRQRHVPLATRLRRLRAALPPIDQRQCPTCGGRVEVVVDLVQGRDLLYGSCLLCSREVDLTHWLTRESMP